MTTENSCLKLQVPEDFPYASFLWLLKIFPILLLLAGMKSAKYNPSNRSLSGVCSVLTV